MPEELKVTHKVQGGPEHIVSDNALVLFKQFRRMAMRALESNNTLGPPMAFFINEGGAPVGQVQQQDDDDDKYRNQIRTLISVMKPTAYVILSEAWVKTFEQGESLDDAKPASAYPDKEEVVVMYLETKFGETVTAYCPLNRNESDEYENLGSINIVGSSGTHQEAILGNLFATNPDSVNSSRH